MADVTIKGTGVVSSTDFKTVKWEGKTKAGKAVTITLDNAINMGNIDLEFAEKNDTVAQVVFTATYSNTDSMVASEDDLAEPWTITYADGTTAGAGEIMLGAGLVYIGGSSTPIALTRGGSSFSVAREFRPINADGDRGPVKDRIVMDGSTATLTLNTLQILTTFKDLYPATE